MLARYCRCRGPANRLANNQFCVTVFFPIPKVKLKEVQKYSMVAFDLRTIYQHPEGMDLLSDTLVEHQRLLWELEYLAKKQQGDGISDITNRLNLVKAQILLFERLMIGEKIDSLGILVRHYAEILSQPRVEIGKATL